MMDFKQFEIWLADLNPRRGTEPGKTRPVVIIQTNFLNKVNHPSSIICPISSNVKPKAKFLRVHLNKGETGLKVDCDILVDQVRAIDNQRLIKKLGDVSKDSISKLRENLRIVMDLE